MARGETVVTFDFEFTYSSGGQFVPTNRVVVRAPGLALLDVHAAMKSHVAQAQKGMLDFIIKTQQARDAAGVSDEQPDEEPEQEPDVMQLMSMGLAPEDYVKFMTFVKKVLSNRVSLAFVGDPAAPTPVTEEVWDQIERLGGMPAFEKLVNAFTGFFFVGLNPQTSPPKTGNGASPGSASATKAPLPMSRRGITRSPAS